MSDSNSKPFLSAPPSQRLQKRPNTARAQQNITNSRAGDKVVIVITSDSDDDPKHQHATLSEPRHRLKLKRKKAVQNSKSRLSVESGVESDTPVMKMRKIQANWQKTGPGDRLPTPSQLGAPLGGAVEPQARPLNLLGVTRVERSTATDDTRLKEMKDQNE